MWWSRVSWDGRTLGEIDPEGAKRLARKGMKRWFQIWDEQRDSWAPVAILGQRFNLSPELMVILRNALARVKEGWPTNKVVKIANPRLEW